MADASALVYVGLDPDTGTPSSLNAFGSGDVISEVIGGTGRTNLSGLFSSVGNVPVSYDSTTRQFVIQDVSGVSATVDFESVRSALAQASAAVGFNGQNLSNVTDLDVSGNLILSGYTNGRALFTSSNGLIVGRSLITGIARTSVSTQPAPQSGSVLQYNTTDSEYQAAQDVRVGSGGALELRNGVGLEIVDAGYISMVGGGILAVGTGGSLAVTGNASVSSLSVSSNATVSGSLSAATYLNLPSATLEWYKSNNTERVLKYVKNNTAASMPKGTPVTVTGVTGDVANIAILSSVNTHVPEAMGFSNHVFGLTDTTIAAGNFGYIVTDGIVSGTGADNLNTSLFSGGDILYVSSNGHLNNIRPPAPYESHPVGYVVRSQSNTGAIYVKIDTVPELNDIVGVDLASSLINGDLISYDLTTSTFKNVQSIDISGTIKGTTVSATTFLNLPSATAIWNANKIQSTTVNSTAPSKSQYLQYISSNEWKPNWNEVSTITTTSVTLTTDIDYWFASAESGPMNLTLPDPTTCQGKVFSVIKADASGQVITVSGSTFNTILNRVKLRMPREQAELLSNGSQWILLSHDRDYGGDTMDSDTNAVFDDFIQGSTETGEAGYAGWSFTNGSISVLAATTFSGSMGVFRRASGTTANQVASFYPLNAGTNTPVMTDHCIEFKLRGRASTTGTDHTVQLGLTSDLTTITPANGFYFERAAASGTWDAITRRASAERRINTGVTYQNANAPDTFRIFIKDLDNVQFYINDVLVANETNGSSTIPLAGIAVVPGFNITPTTTTARNFDVDYIAYTFDGIQERY
jgi:hypothetical protein